jgi:HK97 family phage prohead protease
MSTEVKTLRAEFKTGTSEDGKTGTVVALVSAFGNVDYGGDRMVKGAFADTLASWKERGDPIPFIWSHSWSDPHAYVGKVDPADAKETDAGLEVKATMDLTDPTAAKVHQLLKDRLVTQFSIGYEAKAVQFVDEDGEQVRELHAVELFESGPCLLGMNPDTVLIEAAARTTAAAKAGRVLSAKNERALSQARDLLDGVLKQLAKDAEDDATDDDSSDEGKARDMHDTLNPTERQRLVGLLAKTPHQED